MEPWQLSHIKKNLVRLYDTTICNVGLLAHLQEADVLSPEDVEYLELSSTTRYKKTKLLYDILMTRTNSYDVLIEALEKTKQSGAENILRNANDRFQNYGKIDYNINNLLGEGSYGTKVYGGKFGGRDVAVKVLNAQLLNIDIVHNEIDMLLKLDSHPNVIRYFTSEKAENLIYIALELCQISLQEEVKLNLTQMEGVVILEQCTKGLQYLHYSNVIHRDLKPSNILLTVYKQVKISDFGLSKNIPIDHSSVAVSCVKGTLDYMPPEVIKHDGVHQVKFVSTTISLNANKLTYLLWDASTISHFTLSKGVHLYGNFFYEIQYNIANNNPKFECNTINDKWLPLIKTMIHPVPSERLTTTYILEHDMFRFVKKEQKDLQYTVDKVYGIDDQAQASMTVAGGNDWFEDPLKKKFIGSRFNSMFGSNKNYIQNNLKRNILAVVSSKNGLSNTVPISNADMFGVKLDNEVTSDKSFEKMEALIPPGETYPVTSANSINHLTVVMNANESYQVDENGKLRRLTYDMDFDN